MPRRNRPVPHEPYRPTRSDCSRKRAYRSAHEAIRATELRMLESPGVELSVYQCDSCHQWHMTSKK